MYLKKNKMGKCASDIFHLKIFIPWALESVVGVLYLHFLPLLG